MNVFEAWMPLQNKHAIIISRHRKKLTASIARKQIYPFSLTADDAHFQFCYKSNLLLIILYHIFMKISFDDSPKNFSWSKIKTSQRYACISHELSSLNWSAWGLKRKKGRSCTFQQLDSITRFSLFPTAALQSQDLKAHQDQFFERNIFTKLFKL